MAMMKDLEYLWDTASELKVTDLAAKVIGCPSFQTWTATADSSKHHYGFGGLRDHTIEVIQLCLSSNFTLGSPCDRAELFLAALWHDYGKIWDYKDFQYVGDPRVTWGNTDHKHKIHHVVRSVLEFQAEVVAQGHLGLDIDEIVHSMLSHHGLRENGSPVTPQTPMAWILHTCDMMSARVYETKVKK